MSSYVSISDAVLMLVKEEAWAYQGKLKKQKRAFPYIDVSHTYHMSNKCKYELTMNGSLVSSDPYAGGVCLGFMFLLWSSKSLKETKPGTSLIIRSSPSFSHVIQSGWLHNKLICSLG